MDKLNVSRSSRIEAVIDEYTSDLPKQERSLSYRNVGHHVILTGSTGSLGSYLLNLLLKDNGIARVYCLNRALDGKSKQLKSFRDRGLDVSNDLIEKAEFIHVNFGKEKFGLAEETYVHLTREVDIIIHNAWNVNYYLSLHAFRDPHLHGTRSFIDFSLTSNFRAHIYFISSIASVASWSRKHKGLVPERTFQDSDISLELGYGESKYVAERILEIASSRSGLVSTIIRVGQLGGPSTEQGSWDRNDLVPAIIATSISLGKVPLTLGPINNINWIPSDIAAGILIELLKARQNENDCQSTTVFHLVNPQTIPWKSLIPTIQEFYELDSVGIEIWLEKLTGIHSPTPDDLVQYPALKFLEVFNFFQGSRQLSSVDLDTTHSQKASRTLSTMCRLDKEMMRTWLRQWSFFPELMMYI